MVSYLDLDPNAPFSTAFSDKGMEWAAKIVAVGALIGCTNSNYGGVLGQSRIFVTMARAGLLPKTMVSSAVTGHWVNRLSVTCVCVLHSNGAPHHSDRAPNWCHALQTGCNQQILTPTRIHTILMHNLKP